jgi:hypothetical protein
VQAFGEDDNRLLDETTVQGLDNVDWTESMTFPEQSWWFDYDFDANSPDLTLFEPMAFSEPFSLPSQDTSQLLPHDPILPGPEIQRAWFTYIDDSNSSGTRQGRVAQQPSTLANGSNTYELDEEFRTRACEKLVAKLKVDPLPSTGLLVSGPGFADSATLG